MVIIHTYENLSGIEYLTVMPENAFRNMTEFAGGPLAAPVFMFFLFFLSFFLIIALISDFSCNYMFLCLECL